MNPLIRRGRWLCLIIMTLLILERLSVALIALSNAGHAKFSWTMVVMPLTHILVAIFLWITADQLIYLLVLLWGLITAGSILYDTRGTLSIITTDTTTQIRVGIALFHVLIVCLFLLPSVRTYFASKREVFEEMQEEEDAQNPPPPPAMTE